MTAFGPGGSEAYGSPASGAVRDHQVGHRAAIDQVRLDDALQVFRRAIAVPGAFRVDDGDRATDTHSQAVRLGPQHAAVDVVQAQFLEAALQVIPAFLRPRDRCALATRHAEEDVPALVTETEFGDRIVQRAFAATSRS